MTNKRLSSKSQRDRQHLLEVALRADKERERRIRSGFIVCAKTICWTAAAVGLWFAGREGWRVGVRENPRFFLRAPDVTTDGTLTREQILTVANIAEGQHILTVDLAKVRAVLEKLPQVETAVVGRTFPHRVAITLTERRPVAWVTEKKGDDHLTSGRAFLIDARAIVLRSRAQLPQYANLPVITGVETENLVPGQRANSFAMLAALELVRLTTDSTRFQIRNIDLAKSCRLVVTDQRRMQITFGVQMVEAQLARLNQLLELNEPTHQEIRTVNVIPERYVPVTYYPPEAVSSAPLHDPPPSVPEVKPPKPTPDPKPPKPDAKSKPPKPTPAAARKESSRVPERTPPPKPKLQPQPAPVVSPPPPNPGLHKRFNLDE